METIQICQQVIEKNNCVLFIKWNNIQKIKKKSLDIHNYMNEVQDHYVE